jgi:ADP-ribose pyrophosphatase
MQKWKKIRRNVLLEHPRLRIVEDDVALPDGVMTKYIHFDGQKSAATVLVIKDDAVLMQREYSYPPDKIMLQLPCGAIEEGENPMETAKRELVEESGYTAPKLELIGSYYHDNRRSNAKMYVYLATDAVSCEKIGGDPQEFIESFWMSLAILSKSIADGTIDNLTVLAAWAFFAARQQA